MARRTIESPGVELFETDISNNSVIPVGTNILALGYAAAGPTNEMLDITSISEWINIYGTPTNAAEKYFFKTCEEILRSPGNLITSRLPYGSGSGAGFGTEYSALLFPVSGASVVTAANSATFFPNITSTANLRGSFASNVYNNLQLSTSGTDLVGDRSRNTFASSSGYIIGQPLHVTITETTYNTWNANAINWTSSAGQQLSGTDQVGNAAFMIINKSRTTINELGEGFYIGITDRAEGDDIASADHDSILNIKTVTTTNTYADIATSTLNFNLTSTQNGNSISNDLEGSAGINFGSDDYKDEIILGYVKLRPDPFLTQQTLLQRAFFEGYRGSFNPDKTEGNPNGGTQTAFIGTKINASNNLEFIGNPNFLENTLWTQNNVRVVKDGVALTPGSSTLALASSAVANWDTSKTRIVYGSNDDGGTNNGAQSLFGIGNFARTEGTNSNKNSGAVVSKIDNALILAENADEIPLDIVVDGGLSTIHAAGGTGVYDDKEYNTLQASVTALEQRDTGASSALATSWISVFNTFETFCSQTRKDCMFVSDPLRQIFVRGEQKVLDNNSNNFTSNVYVPLRNLTAASNSNYAATYGNWVKAVGPDSKDIWAPSSGYLAAVMARLDRNSQPWAAPAGYNDGILRNVIDVAINPNQKQRDILYRNSINPIFFSKGDGFVVIGQKTTQNKSSALDRINVRRLFLTLEKATLAVSKYFVMKPNTSFTRTRLKNTLKPIFEIAKNDEGVYDYLIVADERNNTPDVIDANELKVDIYIKPVRTAEFILVNFIATRTSQDFNELI